jgi:hypothetical protein
LKLPIALLLVAACASSRPNVPPCVAHVAPISNDSYKVSFVLTNDGDEPLAVRLPLPPPFRLAALFRGRYVPVERPAESTKWEIAEHVTFPAGAATTLVTDVILRFGPGATRKADERNVWIIRNARAELDLRFLLAAPKPFHVCPLAEEP